MKFIVNSQQLLKQLQSLSGVISSSNTMPIIGCFHLHLEENTLTIKATVASTMYDMTRISGNDYNDAFDVEEARHKNREALAMQRLTDPMAMAGGVLDTVPPQAPRFVHDYHA